MWRAKPEEALFSHISLSSSRLFLHIEHLMDESAILSSLVAFPVTMRLSISQHEGDLIKKKNIVAASLPSIYIFQER